MQKNSNDPIEQHLSGSHFPGGHYLENTFVEAFTYLNNIAPAVNRGFKDKLKPYVPFQSDEPMWEPLELWLHRFRFWGTEPNISQDGGLNRLNQDAELFAKIGMGAEELGHDNHSTADLRSCFKACWESVKKNRPAGGPDLLNHVLDVIDERMMLAPLAYWLYLLDWMGCAEQFVRAAVPAADIWTNTDEILRLLEE